MNKLIRIFTSVFAVLIFTQAQAAQSPLSVSIVPPVQFPPADYNVTGLRLSVLYGQHRDVYGIDLGVLGNITEGKFVGIGVSGLMNYTKGDTTITGLQFAGLANINKQKTSVVGLQVAGLVNYNSAASSVSGVQFAVANLTDHTNIYGVQLGIYNRAQTVYGFQIGLVNITQNLHGLQIGLVNVNNTGVFKVAPILNFGF